MPLILHCEQGGFNTLRQDLYGDVFFPIQAAVLLSEPGAGLPMKHGVSEVRSGSRYALGILFHDARS
ncbi:damaged DNA oxygenase [Oleiphilus messinensis]|uniref:Damaged DNA oxygenase n=1 Tax=Oleiphilus messinensis TaxID=141451 RepID=A0A1Y0IIH8_9GAMM|nr:2OG-Fe(II) oxygenase [Oleiphilus messinensis]ARU59325.1 damaged DNA oxygenase [Oleiphilus messinensis]